MGIIVGTVEKQLSMMGHNIHSFFGTNDAKDSRSFKKRNPRKSRMRVNLWNISEMFSINGNRVVEE